MAQQLAGLQQKVGARGFAHGLVAGGKGLIHQHTAVGQAVQQGRHEAAPQVVGDHHRVKTLAGQRPGAVFDVGLNGRAHALQAGQGLGRSVHARDGVSQAGQVAHVAAVAAGHIQHAAAGGNQVRPALHPGGRGFGSVHGGFGL